MSLLSAACLTLIAIPLLAQVPPQPDAMYRAGIASLQGHRYDEAQATFRSLIQTEPGSLRGIMGVAQVLVAQAKYDDAINFLREEAARKPERPELPVMMGDIDLKAGRHAAALEQFRKALTLMDTRSASDLVVHSGVDPVATLNGVDSMPKGAAGVYLRISGVLTADGDAKAAIAALRKAKELAPGDSVIVTNLAMLLEQDMDKPAAMAEYRAALELNRTNIIALNNLAFLITDTGGDLYEALRMARLAKQTQPASDEISDTVGWISLKLGWTDDAIDTLRGIVGNQPGNAAFREHLADALEKKPNRSPELNELRIALQAEPTTENQQTVLGLLKKTSNR